MRPDFYLPRHHAVIEYAGRMDLPAYRLRHREKVGLYEYNGIRCYEVFPEDLSRPYWAPRLIDAIEDCLRPAPSRHMLSPYDLETLSTSPNTSRRRAR